MSVKEPRVIVALDYADINEALELISQLDPALCRLKVGKHMFTRFGPQFVRELIDRGFSVFLDLKFHDIPNTVADACFAAAKMGVWMMNVHLLGGAAMLNAARKAIDKLPEDNRPLLIGVTILTSLDEKNLAEVGITQPLELTVLQLAQLAKDANLDGVVCSALEAPLLREKLGEGFLLVTPGIRLDVDDKGDQKRVMTPRVAFSAGADYLVIGRSITGAKDPVKVLNKIQKRAWEGARSE